MRLIYFSLIILISNTITVGSVKSEALNILKSNGLNLIKANKKLLFNGITSESTGKRYKNFLSSGIPNHLVGEFPNEFNDQKITSQTYDFFIRINPKLSKKKTKLKRNQYFGIASNGIPFDPNLDKWFMDKPQLKWQYEALSGAIPLGLDTNHAHVDEKGAYHYHGLPKLLLKKLGVIKGKISPVIGYAADGFSIRALYGENGKPVRSSYTLKKGKRTIGATFDGTFIQDYEFLNEAGDLDECNGAIINGQYSYFITSSFPVIPRCFVGKPHKSFLKDGKSSKKKSL